jgi:hypothetical protein
MFPSTDTDTSTAAPASETDADRAASRLRNVLRLNAALSTITGLTAVVAGGPIGRLLGVEQIWAVRLIGAGLLAFATLVAAAAATRTRLLVRWGLLVSIADLTWVAATIAVVALGWFSGTGTLVMSVLALVVLDLAVAQLRGRSRLTTSGFQGVQPQV